MAQICETLAETCRLTRVSAVSLLTFNRVSVAAVRAEPYPTFFLNVSVEFQLTETNFSVLTCAETHGTVPEI